MNPNALRHFGRTLPVAPSFQQIRRELGAARRPSLGEGFAEVAEQLRKRGPILPVQIGIPSALAAQMQAQGQTPPPPEEIPALIDTGASITAINVATAQRLGLQATGSIQIGGANGVADQPLFAAMVRIPDPFVEWDPMTLAGSNLTGVPFEILIGRNVLCNMTFSYDGKSGRFSLIL
jgi:hypothetical protein